MDLKTINKSWYDFIEFKVKPFALSYFLFPINFYTKYLSTTKADLKTLLNFFILRRKLKLQLKVPTMLTVVASNICNASCIFCAYRYLTYKKETMPLETFKKVIDEYKELDGKELTLSPTVGEDLINKDFFEFVKYAKKQGFKITVFTNGILLNIDENYKKIINSGIDDIFVSTGDLVSSYEAEIFRISHELASQKIKGLLQLLEYKLITKSEIKITIAFRAKRSFRKIWNSMKKTKFKGYFEKRMFYILFKTCYDNWCGNITRNDLQGIMRIKREPLFRKYPCSALWSISILPNGDVRLCGCRIKDTEHDGLVIGNIKKNRLMEIIQSERAEKIFSDWIAGKYIDICIDCTRYMFPKSLKRRSR